MIYYSSYLMMNNKIFTIQINKNNGGGEIQNILYLWDLWYTGIGWDILQRKPKTSCFLKEKQNE